MLCYCPCRRRTPTRGHTELCDICLCLVRGAYRTFHALHTTLYGLLEARYVRETSGCVTMRLAVAWWYNVDFSNEREGQDMLNVISCSIMFMTFM